ncbi:mechanosensitive ion channel [Erythrobacter sp. SCSIO 43205]|nr:mechanosensitive ion channel [Erythrobacter sp. SCSIO 43205]
MKLGSAKAAALKLALCGLFSLALAQFHPALAQNEGGDESASQNPIEIAAPDVADAQQVAADQDQLDALITQRLTSIYDELSGLDRVRVITQSGVVTLSGEVANGEAAQEAIALAERVEGVILVRDQIERLRDIESNLSPAVEGLSGKIDDVIAGLPLLAVAIVLFLVIAMAGHLLARWKSLWSAILPNVFLAELVAQAVRVIAIIIGLVGALNLLGANALMGTILGGAGVVGIAIGFAVRDTLENYVASIMLSLRQPFRSEDHVVIGDREGIVIRLTSRATILMTMEGNHLRIPNADVFKATILNYTRNPERRFEFVLGVDAEDDPALGIETGVEALKALPFLLETQEPFGIIEEVGDSSIVLRFFAWVDQRNTDFPKARSLAIRAAKNALEENGFTLPEPIYRLRFDQMPAALTAQVQEQGQSSDQATRTPPSPERMKATDPSLNDVAPDSAIKETVEKERSKTNAEDLLDETRPVE